MFAAIYGLFGLIIGSFTNVVVLRSGVVSLAGRSGCMSCGAKIRWFDLIPVFSWIALRGKCRACGSRISIQYPIVEFCMAAAFVLVGASALPSLSKILGLLISAVLIAIVAYDILHTIIPNAWVYTFAALALLSSLLTTNYLLLPILSGPAVALPLFALWFVSGGKWIGLGDAKLALGIGWLLGPLQGLQALLLAFIIGAIVGLGLIALSSLRSKAFLDRFTPMSVSRKLALRFTMKSEIPFGPFLIAACMFQWFTLMYNIPIPFLWQ